MVQGTLNVLVLENKGNNNWRQQKFFAHTNTGPVEMNKLKVNLYNIKYENGGFFFLNPPTRFRVQGV